jgi:4-hydroxy-2-oxoheptanedioate aldolase
VTTNRLRELLARGEVAFGGWCSSGSPITTEILATEGYDYVCVDLQHGVAGPDTLLPTLLAMGRTGATPVVRVATNDEAAIGRALDLGAEAIIVPMIDDPDAATRAAAACRYPPLGVRSYGPTRSRLFLNQSSTDEVDRQVQCFVMIETRAAVEQAAAICASPGIDGVYVGPADLALSYGRTPGSTGADSDVEKAIESVRLACLDAGIVPAIHTANGVEARRRIAQGFAMATVGTDTGHFRTVVAQQLRLARGDA